MRAEDAQDLCDARFGEGEGVDGQGGEVGFNPGEEGREVEEGGFGADEGGESGAVCGGGAGVVLGAEAEGECF